MERPPSDQERSSGGPGRPARSHGRSDEPREGRHLEGSHDRTGGERQRSRDGRGDRDPSRPPGGLQGLVDRYGPTRGAQRHAGAQDHNRAGITALVLGVLSLAVLLPSFGGLFFLSLPLGIAAIVLGVIGKRKVARRVAAKHRRSAHAGLVLGAIGTALSLVVVLLLALGVAGLTQVIQSVPEDRGGGSGAGGQREALEQKNDQQRRGLEERAARQRRELEERAARQREELRRRDQEGG